MPSVRSAPCGKRRKFVSSARTKLIILITKIPRDWKSWSASAPKFFPEEFPGTCAVHQRQLTVAVKRARQMALIPYVSDWAAFCSSAQAGWWTKSGVSLIMYAGPKGWKPNEFNGWQTSVSLNQRVRHFEKWRTRWLYFVLSLFIDLSKFPPIGLTYKITHFFHIFRVRFRPTNTDEQFGARPG